MLLVTKLVDQPDEDSSARGVNPFADLPARTWRAVLKGLTASCGSGLRLVAADRDAGSPKNDAEHDMEGGDSEAHKVLGAAKNCDALRRKVARKFGQCASLVQFRLGLTCSALRFSW